MLIVRYREVAGACRRHPPIDTTGGGVKVGVKDGTLQMERFADLAAGEELLKADLQTA